MSRPPCSTLGNSAWGTLLVVGVVILLTVVGIGTLGVGLSGEFGPVARAAGLLVSAIAWVGVVGMLMAVFPRGGRLRVEVCEDALEFHRPGAPPTVVRREEIGRVVVKESLLEGVESFEIYRPDDTLRGTWETGWCATLALFVMRTLKEHGYPCGLRDPLYKGRLFYQSHGRRGEER